MNEKKLTMLWTNGDVETSLFMVLMYATNSILHQWWDEVTVVLWGAPARLAAENEDVRQKIRMAQHAGVRFEACIACAEQLGVVEQLKELGIALRGWGNPLTELLQSGAPLLTV